MQIPSIDSRQVSGVTSLKSQKACKVSEYIKNYQAACRPNQPTSQPPARGQSVSGYITSYNQSVAETRAPLYGINPFRVLSFPDSQLSDGASDLYFELNEAVKSKEVSVEAVKTLMEKGAVPTHHTLNLALESQLSIDVLRLLVAQIVPTDATIVTALCCRAPLETVALLIEKGQPTLASLQSALGLGAAPEIIKLLLDRGIKPRNEPMNESTLDLALFRRYPMETIEQLLQAGAVRYYYHLETALRRNAPIEMIKLLIGEGIVYYEHLTAALEGGASIETLQLLVDKGASAYWYHLHVAIHKNAPLETFEFLVKAGARPINNPPYHTTLFVAEGDVSDEIINFLKEHGAE